MSMQLVRTPGPVSWLPGSVTAGGLVFTSGMVSPSAFERPDGDPVPAKQQIVEALRELESTLTEAGTTLARMVKIEAFVAAEDMMDAWNEEFLKRWPVPGPARTTLIARFARAGISFEVQGVAAL
jgi:enamine deaminase RidA (YjgF/YER057c/UK114 family)